MQLVFRCLLDSDLVPLTLLGPPNGIGQQAFLLFVQGFLKRAVQKCHILRNADQLGLLLFCSGLTVSFPPQGCWKGQ